MAAIDKIYVNTWEEYLAFKEWCEQQPVLKDKYGTEVPLTCYLINWSEWNEGPRPIFNAPYYVDAYLIRNCPFEFIQDELKFNYGYKTQEWINEAYNTVMHRTEENKNFYKWLSPDDFKVVDGIVTMPNEPISDYELIKEGKLYATPYTQKEHTIGKKIRCILHPDEFYNRPFKFKYWCVDVDVPDDIVWYHPKYNTWDFTEEFVCDNSSSICWKYKTIKAVKRAILKWKLPVGTIVTCTGRYVDDVYKFIVL